MEVKLGMSPISWTNDDLPELGGDTSLETCLKETRLAGFSGTELGGKFPKTPSSLKEVLEEHELKLISGSKSRTKKARTELAITLIIEETKVVI